jgi:uncharacterized sulfatase
MDERYDLVRSVTDGRYVYLRQYMPHLVYGQHVDYMFQTPTTQVWKKLHDEGKLTAAQDHFWKTKPPEELYDLHNDPDEVNNLAGSPEHQEVLARLRRAQQELARSTRDLGFLPEGERFSRAPGVSPYDMGQDASKYPFDRIFAVAEQASLLRADAVPALTKALTDEDSAVRYWAALGLLMRGQAGHDAAAAQVRAALTDRSPHVRIVAAEVVGKYGRAEERRGAVKLLAGLGDGAKHDVFVAMAALNALGTLGERVTDVREEVRALPAKVKVPDPRYAPYVPRLLQDLTVEPR